jgi:hypothetical protein
MKVLTQRVTELAKKNFLSYIFILCNQFYFVVPGLNTIGHGNPNVSSSQPSKLCISVSMPPVLRINNLTFRQHNVSMRFIWFSK